MANRPENIIVAGLKRTIEYAVLDDGSMPAKEFIDSLLQTSPHAETDILARFRHIADGGEANATDQMFKRERDPFSAFKCKVAGQFVRLPCFRRGNRWIITHGFTKVKSKSKWPEQEFNRANEIMNVVIRREERQS